MSEIIDQSVKKELEIENCVINWNREVTVKLKSKLRPLWNRTAGDCLLDAVLQATWGVFDSQNVLRKALAEALKMVSVPQNISVSNPAASNAVGGGLGASLVSSEFTDATFNHPHSRLVLGSLSTK